MTASYEPTLLLDQSYRPVGVVSWQDAVTMMFTDKVDVVAEYDTVIRSSSLEMGKPAVVRLRRGFKREVKPVKFSRVNIYARDEHRCQYCGEQKDTEDLTYDHILPRSRGGRTEWTNIVACCHDCNRRKANRTPAEAGMKLLKKPVQPSAMPEMFFESSRRKIPDAWRDYVYWTSELEP